MQNMKLMESVAQCVIQTYFLGKRVHKPCDEYTSTTCDSCLVMTYTDAPNGLTECLPCSFCDPRTEFSDTVCDDCPAGSYSDGTLCKLHTKCESLGKTTVKAGTETTDAECSNGEPSYLLILSVCGVCALAFVIGSVVIIVKKNVSCTIIK
ncbi:hypothetical protein cypCar_00003137 [Cyprinus carpio]|nr:hypothetical protein cypCar_00003137 [Cyprinus carpio]